jgi:hypothetical protein
MDDSNPKKMEQQMFKISDTKIRDGDTIYLVVWNMNLFFHILGTMIPADEVIFFRGVAQPPTRYIIHSTLFYP